MNWELLLRKRSSMQVKNSLFLSLVLHITEYPVRISYNGIMRTTATIYIVEWCVTHFQAGKIFNFPASCAKFPSSRVDFPPVWKGFPYIFLYFFSPNHKISLQGASRFAHFSQACVRPKRKVLHTQGVTRSLCTSNGSSHLIL